MRFGVLAAIAACGLLAFSGLAEARERPPRESVLAQVRAGGFANNCAGAAAAVSAGSSIPGAPGDVLNGVRLLPDGAAATYLRQTLQRFMALQPPPAGVTPNVWIQDTPEVDARLRGAGSIYLTRGALDALLDPARGVDDPQVAADIAFLLAHEYSHVLMCHYNRVVRTDELTQAFDTMASLGVMAHYLKETRAQQGPNGQVTFGLANEGRFRDGVASTMSTQSALNMLNTGVLNPAWGRDQERDADFLAVELMHAAGMPTDYVPELLVNLHTAEASFFSEFDTFLGALPETLVSDLTSAQASGQGFDMGGWFNRTVRSGGRELLQRAVARRLGHFHDNPDDRAERVALMMDFLGVVDTSGFAAAASPAALRFRTAAEREFRGPKLAEAAIELLARGNVTDGCANATQALAAGPSVPSALLAAGNCAVARNNSAQAAQHFGRLTQSPYAIPQDFVTSSQIWAAARNRPNANRALDTGAARFGTDAFYVPRMLVAAAFSDMPGVTSTRDQCVNTAQQLKLKNECTAVAGQITGQTAQAQQQQPQNPANPAQNIGNSVQQLGNSLGGLFGNR